VHCSFADRAFWNPRSATTRRTSSVEDEATTNHIRHADELSAASPNTEVGHHREPLGGSGADDPPATTKHIHTAVDVGSAVVVVLRLPAASLDHYPAVAALAKATRCDVQHNHRSRLPPRSRHGPYHIDPRPAPLPAGGHRH
jgi:hypothetical protein